MEKRIRSIAGSREVAFLALCAIAIAGSALAAQSPRAPVSSSEMRFVETSAQGMRIVPASCESNPPQPHWPGECDGGTPTPPSGTCRIYADPRSVTEGGSSMLTWTVGDYQTSIVTVPPSNITLTGFGSVPRSGSQSTGALSQTTTYVLSGVYSVAGIQIGAFSCSRTVTVAGQCVPTYSCVGNGVSNSCTGGVTPCGSGLVCQNAQCVCPGGAPPVNGQCNSQCPAGQHPLDWTSASPACVCNANNQPPVDGQCPIAQCTEQFYCSGDDLWIRNRNNQCSDGVLEQTCSYGCSNGACTIPTSTGNIVAEPRLVRSGETTTVSWETEFMEEDSCTVSENNPEINDSGSGPSGTFVTSAIRMQTRYTLNCTRANGQAFSDFDIVNVIPIFEEQ